MLTKLQRRVMLWGMARSQGPAKDIDVLENALRGIEDRFRSQPRRLRFILSGVRELSRVAANLSEQQLRELPAPATSSKEFSRALVEHLAEHLPAASDPLARARARGILAERDMLDADGPDLVASEVAKRLRISRQAIDKRRQAGKLLAVSAGSRIYRYPRWQFTETGILTGLEDVLRALAPHPPWAQLRFFVSGNHRLGGERPVDVLRSGRLTKVLQAAQAFGEHGAA